MRFAILPDFSPYNRDVAEDRRRVDLFFSTRDVVALDDVKSWIASWGLPEELPPPVPRKIGALRR